jgi:hypothetical protein
MSDSDRLARIEAVLVRLSDAMDASFVAIEAGFAGATQFMQALSDGLVVVEGQMTEALGRIRIISEQLATHTHPEGA